MFQNQRQHARQRQQAGFSLIELLIVVAIIGILAAVAAPKLQEVLKTGREAAAVTSLRAINNNQAQYNTMRGKFGTLKELADSGLLDQRFAGGQPQSQYKYDSPIADGGKYCVQATRQGAGAGFKDFNVIEDGAIRAIESATVNPVPHGEGVAINGGGTDAPAAGGAAPKAQ